MPSDEEFRDLIRRVRAGDPLASVELVRTYEPAIRLAIRVRLTNARLRALMDSADISQSVLGNFFVRAASGQFELERPEQLVGLLVTMAHNQVLQHFRRQQAARRGGPGAGHSSAFSFEPVDPRPGPTTMVAEQDLLDAFRSRFTEEERRIAAERAEGSTWAQIAARAGEQPDAVRIRMSRALDRIARQLCLDD
jgi:RNA polymerase sigma-70 factor (ECF subfamily)